MRQMRLLTAAILILSPLAANALPIFYDENVDGDLVIGDTLSLDFGVNVIMGTVSNPLGPAADFDKFDVILPARSILRTITLHLTNGDGGNGLFAWNFEVLSADYRLDIIDANTRRGGFFVWSLNRSFSGLGFNGLNGYPAGIVNDYTIKYDVVRIPEPSSLALLSIGLFAMGLAGRRKT